MFPHGYGMKAKGMGGASVAMADNAFAGANNPAIAAWAGNRMEAGIDLNLAELSMERTGVGVVTSESPAALVPEFGYNQKVNDTLGLGVTMYVNGGSYAGYPSNTLPAGACGAGTPASNVFCGTGRLGGALAQIIVAPTIAYKLDANHAVGVSPLLVHQVLKLEGLQAFAGQSSSPQNLTDNGDDFSNGMGIRLGYLGKLSDRVMVGAAYSPRIAMSKFSKYAGLLADQGSLDVPEMYSLGISAQATPEVTLALDYQHIAYNDLHTFGNPTTGLGGMLGDANGPGFAWKDMNVYKLGVQWEKSQNLTLRAGINLCNNPVPPSAVTLNAIVPGIATLHYTLGLTYALSPTKELTVAYLNVPSTSLSGPNPTGGTDTVRAGMQSIGVQMGWRW